MSERMPGGDLPDECPDCGQPCANQQSLITHYSQAHDPPYPWPDRTQRGHEWPGKRKQALERDGHECQGCEATSDLHVHHTNGDKRDHRLENLKTLCPECHYDEHRG